MVFDFIWFVESFIANGTFFDTRVWEVEVVRIDLSICPDDAQDCSGDVVISRVI